MLLICLWGGVRATGVSFFSRTAKLTQAGQYWGITVVCGTAQQLKGGAPLRPRRAEVYECRQYGTPSTCGYGTCSTQVHSEVPHLSPILTTEGLTEPIVQGLLPTAQPRAGDYRRRIHSARGITCKGRLHSANGITGKWHHWLGKAPTRVARAPSVSDRLWDQVLLDASSQWGAAPRPPTRADEIPCLEALWRAQ